MSKLPSFAAPPVVEVALGVQFEPLERLRSLDMLSLRDSYKGKFPKVQEHPPLPSVIEDFGPPRAFRLEARLEMTDLPPVPRYWFLTETESELIQIQQDRFVHNWRKIGTGDDYPRYERIAATFQDEFLQFHEFVDRGEFGPLVPSQCEVTYINHIESGVGWDRLGELGEILTVWRSQYSDPFLSEAENVVLSWSHVIPSESGAPAGRLRIMAEPAQRISDGQPAYRLTLTARGHPFGNDMTGIRSFLDLGREWVVRGFASITTPKMHQIWERQ